VDCQDQADQIVIDAIESIVDESFCHLHGTAVPVAAGERENARQGN
jgi:hypothetical protein